jgi:hypothetical protein
LATATIKKSANNPELGEAPAPVLSLAGLTVGDGYSNGLAIGQLQLTFACDPPKAYWDAGAAAVREVLAARAAVKAGFVKHPAFLKIGQLEANYREAERLKSEARGREQDAAQAVRAALHNLQDPRPHEAAQREAADDIRVFDLRLKTLEEFIVKARADAKHELHEQIAACEKALEAAAREALAEVTGRFLAAVGPLLPELHAATQRVGCLTWPMRQRVLTIDVFELPDAGA